MRISNRYSMEINSIEIDIDLLKDGPIYEIQNASGYARARGPHWCQEPSNFYW